MVELLKLEDFSTAFLTLNLDLDLWKVDDVRTCWTSVPISWKSDFYF